MIEVYDTKSGKIVPVRKKPLGALDKYIIFSIGVLLVYTVIAIVLQVLYGVNLDTITTCVYGFFGSVELVTCGLIKIFKLREGGTE